jgi:hypothetical protein
MAMANVLIPIPRSAFQEGRAECVVCGAFVREGGAMTQLLVQRRFGPHAAAGVCPVCELVTFFALE